MPFGLTNAPATFQRLMNQLFSGIDWQFVFTYLDDILIVSKSFEENLSHVRRVLERLQETAQILGIKQLPTSGGHPQTDGLVERPNQTLKQMLSKVVCKGGKDWDELLGPILSAYRTAPQTSTGETPFMLVYGRDTRLPTSLDFYHPCTIPAVVATDYAKELWKEMKKDRSVAHKMINRAQDHQMCHYDKKAKDPAIQEGDIVMLNVEPRFKLDCAFRGPYRVQSSYYADQCYYKTCERSDW